MIKEPKSNNEKIWPVTSVRALREVSPLLDKGTTLMHVWTTGTGMDTMYHAKEVGGHSKQHDHNYQKQPIEKKGRVAKKRAGIHTFGFTESALVTDLMRSML